eukprot:GHVN01088504.1.p1 GENE.GHVN01088504.1~~GHVN01088504.1.p1  ORF type:complete len:263 (-),score=33.79 GHVN01088504.1:106-894(-)
MDAEREIEKLLISDPNNIEHLTRWLRIKAKKEKTKAREALLKKMPYIRLASAEERERLWCEHLRLVRDDPKLFEEVLSEAICFCDTKTIYMKAIRLVDRHGVQIAETLRARLEKKFYDADVKVFLLRRCADKAGNIEEIRSIFNKSLKGLKKHEEIELYKVMIEAEYARKSVEHGRTLVECALKKFGKNVGLWLQYLKLEMNHGDTEMIRKLFRRALELRHSSKKTKCLLKKYMQFEKSHGTKEDVESVKCLAEKLSLRFNK